jgi:coenzyme F420-reducing hydrogenase delta subunit/Pyruvate/2-oxoacid:ferredoxin oxidoreductase delta subunit
MMSGAAPDDRTKPSAGGPDEESEGADSPEEPEGPRRTLPLAHGVISHGGERAEPPVRGERVLRAGDRLFQGLDRLVSLALPRELNPFAQTGAIANLSLIVAIASGIVLLVWYRTSVHLAYDSVRDMSSSPYLAGLVRSIHRYSSDATMLFVLIHAARLLVARRIGGVRWLAWVTGLFLIGVLWFVGWLGYWLVWDERGQLVALGSARLLDALPIFADPLSRSFLVDERLNSLLFFVVFFLHMLLPLAMGIALWLHITRLSRPEFLTKRWMTVWVLGSFVVVSLLFPADTAGAARMALQPQHFSMDYWYLAPVVLTERLSSGALWAVVLSSGALLFSLPWLLARGRARAAAVVASRCNSCEKCYRDCPYDAIQMVPRADGRIFPAQAQVDPQKCVGCGICAGSCDSAGIGLEWFSTIDQRHRIDQLVEQALSSHSAPLLALVCNESAAASLKIEPGTGAVRELPGYVVVRVPCAGWVHPLTVERALRRGARAVLVVASGPGDCMYREGGKWTALRMSAKREPMLRLDRVDPGKVRVLELFRTERKRLLREAAEFRDGVAATPAAPHPVRRWAAGMALAVLFAGATWGATRLAHAAAGSPAPQLIVSFKAAGKAAERCRKPTEAELAKLPRHMRPKQICERRRSNVRMKVFVDGKQLVDKSYEPHGVWHDGNSVAIERLVATEGVHDVRVEIGDSADAVVYNYVDSRKLTLEPRRKAVVLFDKLDGFRWYE